MVTRTTALVLAVSLLLLGGAWLWSRALTSEVPVPPVALSAPNVPQPSFEPGVAPPPRPPPPVLAVTSPPPEPEAVRPSAPPPPPPPREELAPEQVELDGLAAQGEAQLKDERGGPANWRRAEKFFVRCLTMAPEDQRCKEGLRQARVRIGPKVGKQAFPVPLQDPPPPDPEE